MPNRFFVCLVLPLVIWGASKIDVDLAFACFCSSLLYTVWAVLTTIAEAHERNHRFQKQLWEHQREQSPPREF